MSRGRIRLVLSRENQYMAVDGVHTGNGGNGDVDLLETREWLDSLESVLQTSGAERARFLLTPAQEQGAYAAASTLPFTANTPYINTIPVGQQPLFPGNRDIERRIKSLVRWNAMAMVVRANKDDGTIGGHIATFASSATLYEIGFNHFFHGPDHPDGADHGLLPGPRLARHVRPRLPRRPAQREAAGKLPPRTGRGRRPVVATRIPG